MPTKVGYGGIISAMFWMFIISMFLFWIPVFGPLLAGIVGGKKAGSLSNAMIAVIFPLIILGGGLFIWASIASGLSMVRIMTGLNGLSFVLLIIGPLLIGSVWGGLLNKAG